MVFDYFYTQYLFTAMVILAISSLLGDGDSQADGDLFETGLQFLSQLTESGNFVAAEFKQHADAINLLFSSAKTRMQDETMEAPFIATATTEDIRATGYSAMGRISTTNMTTDAVLSDSFLSDLLTESVLDLDFIDVSLTAESALGFHWDVATGNTGGVPH